MEESRLEQTSRLNHRTPRLAESYVPIYRPAGDTFPGPDSEHFAAGQFYAEWVPNDHAVLQGKDGRWHAFGITHPKPPEGAADIHEAEWMSFHAVTEPGTLREQLREAAWQDAPKLLPPADRPGEGREFYAPAVVEKDGLYYMFYSPNQFRLALSDDLYQWTPKGMLFEQNGFARDPYVYEHDGRYVMVYCATPGVWARTSIDLASWSDPTLIYQPPQPCETESPLVVRHEGLFYLFWCIHDGRNGLYDNRTYVFCSEDPFDFHGREPIAELAAHAPEVFRDEQGDWYMTSAEWPVRGISCAKLAWD